MTVKLTKDKCYDIILLCKNLMCKYRPTIKELKKKIVATFPGVQFGPLHYRELEKDKSTALAHNKGNFSAYMQLSKNSKLELLWWISNLDSAYAPIALGKPDIILETDASGKGWGASDGKTHIGGRWNETERLRAANNEINYLELWAIYLALRAFCSKFQNLIKTDNKTALTYI